MQWFSPSVGDAWTAPDGIVPTAKIASAPRAIYLCFEWLGYFCPVRPDIIEADYPHN
jgi:hypothetical protein